MQSDKIKELIKMKEYLLSVKEFLLILQSSPQIAYIAYDNEAEMFKLLTDDNYSFEFRVFDPEKKI